MVVMTALLAAGSQHACAQVMVSYPSPETDNDHRDDYSVALLNLALRKAGTDYRAKPSAERWSQARTLVHLAEGEGVDVAWSMTSVERERDLLPIRVPMFKGLIGWRIALLRKQDAKLLQHVRSVRDLTAFVAGQGHDWPDKEILRSNGLSVAESTSYDHLFRMLDGQRFDYFPRAVTEIWPEFEAHRDTEVIDSHLLLHYPTAAYFFVRKGNARLADAIARGLEAAIADGSFDALFQQHFGAALARLNLGQRRVIELRNPLLPPQTPLARSAYWYAPGKE